MSTAAAPTLEQQMAWSKVVHERLEKKCVHDWEELYRESAIMGCYPDYKDLVLWSCRKPGCEHVERQKDVLTYGDHYADDAADDDRYRPPEDQTPNYCTHALAWPALQKMLREKPTRIQRAILGNLSGRTFGVAQDEAFSYSMGLMGATAAGMDIAYRYVLAHAQPWQIVQAIAETLTAENPEEEHA